jgi:hypothetical protein
MSERFAVQNPMLRYAQQIGWDHVAPAEALRLRGGETGPFFTDVLDAQLCRLNPGIVDAARAADLARQLRLLKPTIEGNREALAWLRGENSVFVPEQNRERNVTLIDFANPAANVFHVTDEWPGTGTARAGAPATLPGRAPPPPAARRREAPGPSTASSSSPKVAGRAFAHQSPIRRALWSIITATVRKVGVQFRGGLGAS